MASEPNTGKWAASEIKRLRARVAKLEHLLRRARVAVPPTAENTLLDIEISAALAATQEGSATGGE